MSCTVNKCHPLKKFFCTLPGPVFIHQSTKPKNVFLVRKLYNDPTKIVFVPKNVVNSGDFNEHLCHYSEYN